MPIRFRCAYCNQLMGIARRKAGKVVKCPKCTGEIIVPTPEDMAAPANESEPAGDEAFVDTGAPPPTVGATAATDLAPAPEPTPPPAVAPPRRLGIFLSIGALAISIIVILLMLTMTFVLGLIIGRQTSAPM